MPYSTTGAGTTISAPRVNTQNYVGSCDPYTGALIRTEETLALSGGSITQSKIMSGWVEPRGEPILTHYKWIPRGPLLKEPKEPIYQKYSLLPRLLPRRSGQSDASWNKALTKYRNLYAKATRWNSKLLAKNARRSLRYERCLQLYRKQQKLLETGLLRWRRPVKTCGQLDDHYYSRTESFNFGIWTSEVTISADRAAVWKWYGIYELDPYPIPYSFSQNNVSVTVGFSNDYGTSPLFYVDSSVRLDLQSDEDNLGRLALSRAFTKIKNQDYSLGEMTAERHQSFGMIRELLIKLSTLISFKNADRLTLVKHMRDKGLVRHVALEASNDFLMWQFGLKPLMQDLYAIVQDLSNEARNTGLITVHGSAVRRASRSYGGVQCYTMTSVRYVLRYKVQNEALAFLSAIGLANPVEILWEVTKWSFVVDWFIAIGQYIDHLTAWTGLDFAGGTKAIHHNYTLVAVETTVTDPTATAGLWKQTQERRFVSKTDTKVRQVLTDPPMAQFPLFKDPFTFFHVSEAIALIVQRLRK